MIEAIPNLSEGRDPAILRELDDTIRSAPGVFHLGMAPDTDHNRTVYSFATDSPEAMREVTLRLFETAVRTIDLTRHTGEHPRVGAVDVFPLVPLAGTEISECVDLAERLGAEVAATFGLPVFLYEYAARQDYRRALPAIRSGGLSRLTRKMMTPEWKPDFGPDEPHPTAGVTIMGARRPLIAFNIQLSTDDIAVAEEIARTVRTIGGGLEAVRALPIRLAGRGVVQVSMNLLDYARTSMLAAFNAVEREAEKRGVEILSSELIGLAPADALFEVAAKALKLENFSTDLVLEMQIEKEQRKRD